MVILVTWGQRPALGHCQGRVVIGKLPLGTLDCGAKLNCARQDQLLACREVEPAEHSRETIQALMRDRYSP